jgi:hypothetical protein
MQTHQGELRKMATTKKELDKIWKALNTANDKIIQAGKGVVSISFVIKDNSIITIIPLVFRNSFEKNIMRDVLKKIVAQSGADAYALFIDTMVTSINKKKKKVQSVSEAVLRILYTPKDKISITIPYKDNKIIESKIETINGRKKETIDEWDLWGRGFDFENSPIEEKIIREEYRRFKEANPHLFKDVI